MRHNTTILITLAVSSFVAPSLIDAQQRGAVPMQMTAPVRAMPMAAPVAHPGSAPAVHPYGRVMIASTHPAAPRIPRNPTAPRVPVRAYPSHSNTAYTNGTYRPVAPVAEDDYGVPGLGFDYVHYAATHPNAGHRRFQGGAIFPFVGGGIFIPTAGYYDLSGTSEPGPEAQANETAEVAPEVTAPSPTEESAAAPRLRSRAANTPPATATPEYIFVRRDGTVFFAVAYSWVNGNLQYVTQDGMRKLVSTNSLDLDATTQFNEVRGVSFRSPA